MHWKVGVNTVKTFEKGIGCMTPPAPMVAPPLVEANYKNYISFKSSTK